MAPMTLRTRRSIQAVVLVPPGYSLRSYFPMEVVLLILSYLPRTDLYSLTLVSFGSLEEASPKLYSYVRLSSEKAHFSFFAADSLASTRPNRLRPLLSTIPTRRLWLDLTLCPNMLPTNLRNTLLYKRSSFHLPRFANSASPILLDKLRITHFGEASIKPLLEIYDVLILPHLSPKHVRLGVDLDLCERRRAFEVATNFSSTSFLRNWDRLGSVDLRGWIPMGYQSSRFFLADLGPPLPPPPVPGGERDEGEGRAERGRTLELSMDLRSWKERWRPWLLMQVKGSGVLETRGLGVGGLRWKVSAGKEEEDLRTWMVETLEEREREKIVLVLVP